MQWDLNGFNYTIVDLIICSSKLHYYKLTYLLYLNLYKASTCSTTSFDALLHSFLLQMKESALGKPLGRNTFFSLNNLHFSCAIFCSKLILSLNSPSAEVTLLYVFSVTVYSLINLMFSPSITFFEFANKPQKKLFSSMVYSWLLSCSFLFC